MVTQNSTKRDSMAPADDDLRRRVVTYLFSRQLPTLRRLQVDANSGTVVLEGRVSSFYEKQVCLNCCRRVAGVVKLVDRVAVA